jgi:hypothetical protein
VIPGFVLNSSVLRLRWWTNGFDGMVERPHRLPPTEVEKAPPLALDLASGEIRTIIWATGYRPDYSGSSFLFSIARGWSVTMAGWFHPRAHT